MTSEYTGTLNEKGHYHPEMKSKSGILNAPDILPTDRPTLM